MHLRCLAVACVIALGAPRVATAQPAQEATPQVAAPSAPQVAPRPTPPPAPQQGPSDLARLSIEELLNVEVTTVSRKEQRADTASAAVYVITQDDIRRSGIRTLPDLFRLVPGVQVAQVNANNWAIAVRGFNNVYSNNLLVLIDGRSIYNRAFSGVFWNSEDLMVDDIDRIEVVRGPGGAIWGANAVNGVINIVTKSAAETPGALVRVGYGSFDQGTQLALRYGGTLGGPRGAGLSYRVSSQWADREASLLASDKGAGDSWEVLTNNARVDWERDRRAFMAAGGYTVSDSHPLFTVLVSPLPEIPPVTDGRATRETGFALSRFTQTFASGASLQLQAFFNHRRFEDPNDFSRESTGDVDLEYHTRAGSRQDLVLGGGVRRSVDTNEGTFAFHIDPTISRETISNVFAQDEISLTDRVRLTLGSKLEHDTIVGFTLDPTARVGWDLVPGRQHIWAATSRALRTPSSTDLGMLVQVGTFRAPDGTPIVVALQGNPTYESERLIDAEVGYRAKVRSTVDFDLTAFRGRYTDAQTLEPQRPVFVPTPLPHLLLANQFTNLLTAETAGVEAVAHWTPTRIWRLDASYSGFHFVPHPAVGSTDPNAPHRDGNAPAHQWQVHSALWLGPHAELNASLFHVGRLQYLNVPAYTRADLRFELKVASPLSIVAVGQNLLEPGHYEYSGAEAGMVATRIPRSGSVHLVWRFRTGS